MEQWKTVDREVVLDRSPWVRVERHVVRLPDGTEVDDWTWLDMPDFAIVIPVTAAGEVVCFRQVKYGIDGVSLAPPGGYLDPGEDPLTGGQRELLEETGYATDDWRSLGSYVVDGNRGCGTAHLFLATGARRVTDPDADDLEEQEMLLVPVGEFRSAVLDGAIKVLSWAAPAALALLALDDTPEGGS